MKNITLPLSYPLRHPKETITLGARFAECCSMSPIIFLKGPLGAGKTTFAQGLIGKWGGYERIKSPTYTLLEKYSLNNSAILHFDLYRLNVATELEDIGIRDYTTDDATWLVEWPEKAQLPDGTSLLPSPDLVLSFAFLPNSHQVVIDASSSKGKLLLAQLMETQISVI